jgi:hypothetical protein
MGPAKEPLFDCLPLCHRYRLFPARSISSKGRAQCYYGLEGFRLVEGGVAKQQAVPRAITIVIDRHRLHVAPFWKVRFATSASFIGMANCARSCMPESFSRTDSHRAKHFRQSSTNTLDAAHRDGAFA